MASKKINITFILQHDKGVECTVKCFNREMFPHWSWVVELNTRVMWWRM